MHDIGPNTEGRAYARPSSLSKKSAFQADLNAVKIAAPLYSEEEGRRSIDPVVLFKIVLLQHLDGDTSLKKIRQEVPIAAFDLRRLKNGKLRTFVSLSKLNRQWAAAGAGWDCL